VTTGIDPRAVKMAIVRTHRPKKDSVGLAFMSQNQGYASVWGGTLDGIRGLLAGGVTSHNPIIESSLKWLLETTET